MPKSSSASLQPISRRASICSSTCLGRLTARLSVISKMMRFAGTPYSSKTDATKSDRLSLSKAFADRLIDNLSCGLSSTYSAYASAECRMVHKSISDIRPNRTADGRNASGLNNLPSSLPQQHFVMPRRS